MERRKGRSSIQNQVVIHTTPRNARLTMGGTGSMGRSLRTNVMSSSAMMTPRNVGELAQLSKRSVDSVKEVRDKEKHAISGLNLKLADYMEKMKFLEGQNNQLRMELDKWKAMKMFDDTKIKEIHSEEIDELREEVKRLNEANSKLQAENVNMKEKYDDLKEDMDKLKIQLSDEEAKKEKMIRANEGLEHENRKLANTVTSLTDQLQRLKDEIKCLKDDLERARCDLQAAREDQLNAANELVALQKELEFELDCKEQECEELKKIIKQLQSIEPNYGAMWEGQFKDSLQKLQMECDQRIQGHMDELNRNYELKLAQMQANMPRDNVDSVKKVETKTLKSEIGNLNSKLSDLERDNASLKAQLDALRKEYQRECEECEQEKERLRCQLRDEQLDKQEVQDQLDTLHDTNISLQEEINVYSALMNTGMGDMMASQGNYQSRGGAMVSQAVLGGGGGRGSSSGGGSGGGSSSQSSMTVSESTGRRSVQKQSNCMVVIDDIEADGSSCTLINNTGEEYSLANKKLLRTFTGSNKTAEYVFKNTQSIPRGGKVRVFSALFADESSKGDIVAGDISKCKTWGSDSGEMTMFDLDNPRKILAKYTLKIT